MESSDSPIRRRAPQIAKVVFDFNITPVTGSTSQKLSWMEDLSWKDGLLLIIQEILYLSADKSVGGGALSWDVKIDNASFVVLHFVRIWSEKVEWKIYFE